MEYDSTKQETSHPAEGEKSFFQGISDWVSDRIDGAEIETKEIKSTLDQDETEWAAPSWCNFANTLEEHNHTCSFANMDLRGRSMRGAHLMMADLSGVEAAGVSFSGADLSYAEACGGDFSTADFSGADLCKIDLRNSDLRGSNFSGADLTQAELDGANLCGANLLATSLESCSLRGARYDSSTKLPFSLDEANRREMHNVTSGATDEATERDRLTSNETSHGGIYD